MAEEVAMRSLRTSLILAVLVLMRALGLAASSVQLFSVEADAQMHCPTDAVDWLNTPSGVDHFKGMRMVREHDPRRVHLSEGGRPSWISCDEEWAVICPVTV
jgi:hypothetical protein